METAVRFAPNVDIFIMESPYYSEIRSTWRRVDGKWGLSHRERQGVSKQERRMQWEQRKRESRIQRTTRTQPAGVFQSSWFEFARKADLTPTQCDFWTTRVVSIQNHNFLHELP